MLGFIELHLRATGSKATPRRIAIAVERIVDFLVDHDLPDCARITIGNGCAESESIPLQESYDEVLEKLAEFQRELNAASRPPRPFVRTHRSDKK